MTQKAVTVEQSIVNLTRKLVRARSQAYIDSCEAVFDVIEKWIETSASPDLVWHSLKRNDERVAIVITVEGREPGPIICLDACVDTAPAGDPAGWKARDPFSGAIERGTMYGRGVADSKAAVAMFCHLAEQIHREGLLERGALHVVFDGDEHTGNFAGIKAYIEDFGSEPDFVAIGYPGDDKIVVGARGFYRANVTVYGREAHSGGTKDQPQQNAILKASQLIERLMSVVLPPPDSDFPLPPKISVTRINGGTGFSQVPGLCEVGIDFRLTPSFGRAACETILREAFAAVDADYPTGRETVWKAEESWPSYRLPEEYAPVREMKVVAERELGRDVPLVVCGPSNIGNYLAAKGIPATCGFGAQYKNIHAPDEQVDTRSIGPVYQTYLKSVIEWSRIDKELFKRPDPPAEPRRLRQAR